MAVVLALGVSIAGAAKLYKWVDPDGKVSYHDRPPPEGSRYRVEEKDVRTGAGASAGSEAMREAMEKFPVVLYVAPKCLSCDAARTYLKNRNVPFAEKNVEGNRQLQDELIKQAGGLAVPTITVGPKVMRGFLESLLEGELDQAGYPKAKIAEQTEEPAKAQQ